MEIKRSVAAELFRWPRSSWEPIRRKSYTVSRSRDGRIVPCDVYVAASGLRPAPLFVVPLLAATLALARARTSASLRLGVGPVSAPLGVTTRKCFECTAAPKIAPRNDLPYSLDLLLITDFINKCRRGPPASYGRLPILNWPVRPRKAAPSLSRQMKVTLSFQPSCCAMWQTPRQAPFAS